MDIVNSWLPAREIVKNAIESRMQYDKSGSILVLDQYCPWSSHVFELEKEMGVQGILYALYGDTSGSWRVQAVPLEKGSFQNRKPLPEPWRGVRDEALSQLTGVDGCIFIHAAGFTGGCKTKEGALQLAKMAVAYQ